MRMDLNTTSNRAFKSPLLVAIAAVAADTEDPFTVTEMVQWTGGAHSSVERTVKRLAAAGLFAQVDTLYSRAPNVPKAFWEGMKALKVALTDETRASEPTPTSHDH
jgi:hypothetical protein